MNVSKTSLIVCVAFLIFGCHHHDNSPTRSVTPSLDATTLKKLNEDLIIASFRLEEDHVNDLLAQGADVNARFGRYDSEIFKNGWSGGLSSIGSENWTPLQAVASSNHYPDPELPTTNTSKDRYEALERMKKIPPEAIQDRDRRRLEIATILIKRGGNLELEDGHGATPLFMAIESRYDDLAFLLIDAGANPNVKVRTYIDDPGDTSPLHHSSRNPKLTEALLTHGANPNAQASGRSTPLHWAAGYGHPESVALLLKFGANANARDDDDETPLLGATKNPLIVKELLTHGADPNVMDSDGDTPLHKAVSNETLESVMLLVEAGANLNARNHAKETPGDLVRDAYSRKDKLIRDYLFKAGDKSLAPPAP